MVLGESVWILYVWTSLALFKCPLTVKHILIDCSAFTDVWNKHFNVTSMKDLFENVLVDNTINFIKEINFYNQL